MRDYIIKNKKKLLLTLYIPFYFIVFYIAEKIFTNDYPFWVTDLPIDDKIPFIPFFALFYVSWYLYMLIFVVYTFFKDEKSYIKFMWFITITFSIGLLCYFCFPNGQTLRPSIETMGDDIFSKCMKWLYSIDTYTNVLPSLHIVGTLAVLFGCFESDKLRKPLILIIATVFAILIILSTMFVKQHAFLDGVASLIISIPVYIIIYRSKLKKYFN